VIYLEKTLAADPSCKQAHGNIDCFHSPKAAEIRDPLTTLQIQ